MQADRDEERLHDDEPWDPLFVHSRREALLIFIVWALALIWAVPFCYLTGYQGRVDVGNLPTIWGIPSWVFWGILAPWIVADLFTIWFCLFYMQDDDLGEVSDEGHPPRGED